MAETWELKFQLEFCRKNGYLDIHLFHFETLKQIIFTDMSTQVLILIDVIILEKI